MLNVLTGNVDKVYDGLTYPTFKNLFKKYMYSLTEGFPTNNGLVLSTS